MVTATSEVKADRPLVGELGKADRRLNAVYRELRKSLSGEQREELVAAQRGWLEVRHDAIREFARSQKPQDEGEKADYRTARNKIVLDLTMERVAILEKLLGSNSRP